MLQLPMVSVVCLCYNHEKFVIQSLNALLSQSYKNIEIIIVDDKSTDNSVEVIEKWLADYPHIVFIKNAHNLGNNKAFNKALAWAKGDFIIDLAADDVLFSDTIEWQMNTFLKYPQAALVFGNAEIINEKNEHVRYHFDVDAQLKVVNRGIKNTSYTSILQGGNCMCSVSAMMKRSAFDAVNGYDETLFYEDLDIWLRLARKNDVIFIDKPLIKKRIVQHSQSSYFHKKGDYAKKINFSTYRILKKAFKMNSTKTEFLALLKRIHHEVKHNIRLKNYGLVVRLVALKLKTEYKIRFTSSQDAL